MDYFNLSEVPVEELYQDIGQFIVDSIDDEWENATIEVTIEADDNGTTYGFYTPSGTPQKRGYFDTDYRMYCVFDELRKRFKRTDQPAWTKARFVMQPSGKFDLDFEYPT